MTTQELIQKVKLIELKAKRKTNSMFLGEYNSSFKGIGMTFSEVRQYQFGDDVRKIDWNKTARFNETFVKVFEEEHEFISVLLVDISASMNFGTIQEFKNDLVAEICATLAFSAIKNNDKVGLILFSDKIHSFIPPAKGNSHVLRIIREILEIKTSTGEANMNLALEFLLRTIKRRAAVFMLSDFDLNNFERKLSIASRKHDLTGIRVFDSKEKTFPDIGLAYLQDLETKENIWVDTSSKEVRRKYSEYYQQLLQLTQNSFIKNGAGFINISTQDDYIKKLFNYFKNHQK